MTPETPKPGTVRIYEASVFSQGSAGGSGYCSFRGGYGRNHHGKPVLMVFLNRRANRNGRGAWWAMCAGCASRRGNTEVTA